MSVRKTVSHPFFLFLIYFGMVVPNPFGSGYGNTWSLFKLAQYAFPMIGCFLFPYFSDVFEGKGWVRKSLSRLLPVMFCIAGVVHAAFYSESITTLMRQYTNEADNPLMAYMELTEKYKDENRVINLYDLPTEHRKVLTYFLRDNRLISNWSSDSYFSAYPYPELEFDSEGIFLIYDPENERADLGLVEVPLN